MRFLVIERFSGVPERIRDFAKMAERDINYKLSLQKKGRITGGGPFLDVRGVCYILETKTIEELGDILFGSPSNFVVDREVHPLGTFEDSLEGLKEMSKKADE
jgi:hypothetical protein